jgi:hypothetical protein
VLFFNFLSKVRLLTAVTLFRTALTLMFLIVVGVSNANIVGLYLSVVGAFVAIVTAGQFLVLEGRYSISHYSSFFWVTLIPLLLFAIFYFGRELNLYLLIWLYISAGFYSIGSLSLELKNAENTRFYYLFHLILKLLALLLIYFLDLSVIYSLVLFSLSDLVFLKYLRIPFLVDLKFYYEVFIIAISGFILQFGGVLFREEYSARIGFEWVMRLLEMPQLVAYTLLYFNFETFKRMQVNKKVSLLFIYLSVILISHLILKNTFHVILTSRESMLILIYNALRILLSYFYLNTARRKSTIEILFIEILFLTGVFLVKQYSLNFDTSIFILYLPPILGIFYFYTLDKREYSHSF